MCIYSKGVKCKFYQLEQMFGKCLKYIIKCSNIQSRNFERAFNTTDTGGVHMSCEKLKQIIINMVEQLDESDVRFLNQMYTIIKRYLARKRRH